MSFFNKYNQIESELLEIYSSMLGSKEIAQTLLNEAIELNKKNLVPANAGDIFLEKESHDEKIHVMLERKRAEGVKDKDIRWWWNLNGVERMLMLKTDEFNRLTLYLSLLESGVAEKEALSTVGKRHPVYGNPLNTSLDVEDRPLPEELKDRVNIYINKQFINNPNFNQDVDKCSSFNALVRTEIRNGII
ncbi:MAG: hypothetical protein M3Q24_01380 [bacterium]|nr:hypothetical protein [bacterium]